MRRLRCTVIGVHSVLFSACVAASVLSVKPLGKTRRKNKNTYDCFALTGSSIRGRRRKRHHQTLATAPTTNSVTIPNTTDVGVDVEARERSLTSPLGTTTADAGSGLILPRPASL